MEPERIFEEYITCKPSCNKSRGFITIATGEEKYYKLAANLLFSYRYTSKNPLPFAIIAEEENKYTIENRL